MKQILDTELDALNICAEALQADGVVALPTETVYGLVTKWDSAAGRERIYHLKHRPSSKRLQMLAPSLETALAAGVADLPALRKLSAKFWPGALTVVVPNADRTDSIGLRIPNHPFMLNLLKKSANSLKLMLIRSSSLLTILKKLVNTLLPSASLAM